MCLTAACMSCSHELVDEEVGRIEKMGVKFVFNNSVSDVSKIMSQGFDALFISPGLQLSKKIDLGNVDKGFEEKGIVGALCFLDSANSLKAEAATEMSKNKHVVIIGGGSVAMDCAITARALGATSIHIVAREKINNLPADVEEIALAQAAGAIFHPETKISSVNANNTVQLESLATKADKGSLQAHSIIVAAGQMLDEEGKKLLKQDGVVLKFMNKDDINDTPAAKTKIYYAGGDAVRGGGATVVIVLLLDH